MAREPVRLVQKGSRRWCVGRGNRFGQKGAPRAPRQGKRVSEIVKSIQRLIITLCAARKSAEQRRLPRARDRQLPAIRGKTCSIIGRITMCVLKVSAQSTGQKLDRCQSALCQVPRASDGERERKTVAVSILARISFASVSAGSGILLVLVREFNI